MPLPDFINEIDNAPTSCLGLPRVSALQDVLKALFVPKK
jgi:hypothetical protein